MGWSPVVVQFGIQILILAFYFNSLCVEVYSLDKIMFKKCIIAGIFASFCYRWNKNTEFLVLKVSEWVKAREESITSDAWQIVDPLEVKTLVISTLSVWSLLLQSRDVWFVCESPSSFAALSPSCVKIFSPSMTEQVFISSRSLLSLSILQELRE